jgi:hypothetical protein
LEELERLVPASICKPSTKDYRSRPCFLSTLLNSDRYLYRVPPCAWHTFGGRNLLGLLCSGKPVAPEAMYYGRRQVLMGHGVDESWA